jgi:hypothetical protein
MWGALGAARDAYESALRYALEREQFGTPVASFQLTQQKLVEMVLEIQNDPGRWHHPRPPAVAARRELRERADRRGAHPHHGPRDHRHPPFSSLSILSGLS